MSEDHDQLTTGRGGRLDTNKVDTNKLNNDKLDDIRAARRELDALIDEIRAVAGYEDFLAEPSFDDISSAADRAPLAYLTAADHGGLALIVDKTQVTHVPLDGLSANAVRVHVDDYLSAYDVFLTDRDRSRWSAALDTVTRWLWDDAMAAVVEAVGPSPGIVLIPGGLLGLLPLHAAWHDDQTTPTGRRYAADHLMISYVPNARSLVAARVLAERQASRLVTVVDPAVQPLPLAAVEAQVAAASFGDSVEVLDRATATPSNIARALQNADVAHLACHGFATLDLPLDSGLELAEHGRLTLRDIFALNLHLRLVVLSACETLMPGTDLPDEVIALPTGLLQAGVGGIVASMWSVADTPTAILMIEFYRRWRWEHLDPLVALHEAQRWLRDTANGEKARVYREALDSFAPWIPPEAAMAVLRDLMLREPDRRDDDGIETWAGFAYVGA